MSNTRRRKGTSSTTTKPSRSKTRQPEPQKRSIDWKKIGLWTGGVVLAVGLIAFIILDQPETIDLPNNPDIPEGVETFAIESAAHVTSSVQYEQSPPVGGPHNQTPLNCGFYDAPVPNENAVHSLEHGAVWVTYQEGLPEEQMSTLRALGNEAEVLVTPYPALDSPVVASVWGAQMQMRFDDANDPDLLAFVASLRNQTAPEVGAGCIGVGQPAE